MRLVVVSDSHGSTNEIESIRNKYEGQVDALIHCGDSELDCKHPVMKSFLAVRGNCDFDHQYPNDIVETVQGNTIFVTHGHLYNVKMSLMNLQYKAKEHHAEFVFFGHSHVLGAEMLDGTLFLNPGSILLPRGRREQTYAIVEKVENRVLVQYYNENHQHLKEFDIEF